MFFFLQAEDGIRYLVRSRGLGDVYKRQGDRHRADGDRAQGHRARPHHARADVSVRDRRDRALSLIHI